MRSDGQSLKEVFMFVLANILQSFIDDHTFPRHKLLSFRVHFLLLDLQELLLQGVVGGGEDGGGQHGVPLLLQHVVDLAVLAAEVEQQTLPLLEHGAAQGQ